MRLADVIAVSRIERAAYPFPWSAGIFRDCLRAGYLCQVLDTPAGIVGYTVISVAAGEAHLLNLCISPERRREGLASGVLESLIAGLRSRNVSRIILEVRPSNQTAQSLYRKAGFSQIGERRNYYPAESGREDALVLALALEPHAE